MVVILTGVDIIERPQRRSDLDFGDIIAAGEDVAHADVPMKRERGWPEAFVKDGRRRTATAPDRDDCRCAGLPAASDELVDQRGGHTGYITEQYERSVQALVERDQARV